MLRTERDATPLPVSRWLKSTAWLTDHLHDRDVVVVDGSYPPVGVTPKPDVHADYCAGHIPGAVLKTIHSVYGHDGFLLEYEQIENEIERFLAAEKTVYHELETI